MRVLSVVLLLTVLLFASQDEATSYYDGEDLNSVSCLVLKDENSIICKYNVPRVFEDRVVTFKWIDPSGETTRQREIQILAGHGSVYDFRYIEGRTKGVWTFVSIDGDKEYTTTFELK